MKKEDSTSEVDPKHKRLLAGPPRTLLSHPDEEEVLNYVLDKAFSQWQLTDELIETIREMFKHPRWQECYLNLLEDDYKSHKLDFRKADEVIKKNMRIVMPDMIYRNVLETFEEFLDALK